MENKENIFKICQQEFTKKKSLKRHLQTNHQIPNRFECKICDSTFGRNGCLLKHVRKFHNKLGLHQCDICPRAFDQVKSSLKIETKLTKPNLNKGSFKRVLRTWLLWVHCFTLLRQKHEK